MAQLDVAKIKIRRGLNSERLQVVLDNGELGFTTDTQRLFVGDGVTLGGIPASNVYVGSFTSASNVTNIEQGDFVTINGTTYVFLGGDSAVLANYYSIVNVAVDNVTIGYNASNQLTVISIGSTILANSIDTTRGLTITSGGLLAVNADGSSVVFDVNGKVSVGLINGTQHGNQGGGSLHAVATTGAAGFMSDTDKTKLNNSPDWTVSPLTNPQTQLIIDSINQYSGGSITNVSSVSGVSINTGNVQYQTVPGNYFLNSQNAYNNSLQPGAIITSSIDPGKITNIGQLPKWSFNTATIDIADKAIILQGGDGQLYGYYYNSTSTLVETDNINWTETYANTKSALMAAISATESNTVYTFRLFDVYDSVIANTFNVKGLVPNYGAYYNNYNGATGVVITQLGSGAQSASLVNTLICNTTVSTSLPISGISATCQITLAATCDGSNIQSNNVNHYITIYDNTYVKHVFYFNNSGGGTVVPSVNVNTYYPSTVTLIHPIPFTPSDTAATIITAVETALNNAGFNVTSSGTSAITFTMPSVGYCLDIDHNYDVNIIASYTVGGDYLLSQTSTSGLPKITSLTQTCADIITSVGTPGIQNIMLPGVPAITYTTQAGTRNSVALIKY